MRAVQASWPFVVARYACNPGRGVRGYTFTGLHVRGFYCGFLLSAGFASAVALPRV